MPTIGDIENGELGSSVRTKLNDVIEEVNKGCGGAGSALEVLDEGSSLSTATTSIDFVGTGVAATNVGNDITVTINGGGAGGHTITEDDVPLAAQTNLNFDGTYFDLSDDVGSSATDVTFSASAQTAVSQSHVAVTVSDSAELNFTLTGQDVSADLINSSVGIARLNATGTRDTTTFLRGDNTFSVPPDTVYTHPNHGGDVLSAGDGDITINANAVTNTKLNDMAQDTIKGRVSSGAGDPEDLTAAQVRAITATETTTELNARDTANRARSAHSGTQLATTISDFQTTVSANTDVSANTASRHSAATLVTTSHDYLSIAGQAITLGPIDLAADVTGELPTSHISPLTADLDVASNGLTDVGAVTLAMPSSSLALTHTGRIYNNDVITYTGTGGTNYGAIGHAQVEWAGEYIFKDAAAAGCAFLFYSHGTITYDTADTFAGGMYALAASNTYVADTVAVTLFFGVDVISTPKFSEVSGGTLTVTTYDGYRSDCTINNAVTVTNRTGARIRNATKNLGSTLTNNVGLWVEPFTSTSELGGTNNVSVLLGATTAPSGNWSIYQDSTRPNRLLGALNNAFTTVVGSVTFGTTHRFIELTSTAGTPSFPKATTAGAGRVYTIRNSRGASASWGKDAADTLTGSASINAGTTQTWVCDGISRWIQFG